MAPFEAARRVLHEAAAARVFPGAVVEAGTRRRVLWREACGRLTFEPSAPSARDDTIFDLASLTKVLATSLIAMRLADDGRLDLDAPVADLVPAWPAEGERGRVRVVDLLAHASGLPAHRPYYETCEGREAFAAALATEGLEYEPRSRSVYSDLGFILLGFALERLEGVPLDAQFERLRGPLGAAGALPGEAEAPLAIGFGVPADAPGRVAPTRADAVPPDRVHDENAAALGGVAGHAGLFGTVAAVGAAARAMLGAVEAGTTGPRLASRPMAARFTSRAGVPGSSRALGWDTMLPSSSCGTRMSPRAFGHTGFTGTSLWIDPAAGLYVVQLTNRVYPGGGTAEDIREFRRALHDAVMADGTSSNRAG